MAKEKTRTPPVTTFLSLEGLAVLAAAGVTAAVASLPVIVLPGAVAYGILTWFRYNRWKSRGTDESLLAVEPDLSALRSPHVVRVRECIALRKSILDEIARAEPAHRALLSPSVDRVRALSQASADLALKLQQIEDHLRLEDTQSLQSQEAYLLNRIHSAHDDVARSRYESALQQQREKAQVCKELQARWERIDAQLTTIQLTLQTVSAQVLRIKSAEAGTASHESVRVVEALDALSVDVGALAETVEETADAGTLESHAMRAGQRKES